MGDQLRSIPTIKSYEWLAFVGQLPASPIQFKAQAANINLTGGRYVVTGLNVTNSATTACTVTLHDGQDTTGQILTTAVVPASGSLNIVLGSNGAYAEIGIYMEVVTGTLTGSVLAVPLSRYNVTLPGQ